MTTTRISPADWPEAVADTDGHQLWVAGPGTGKTTFIAQRVAHLIDERGIPPAEVLVLTFSRRGASRLRRHIDQRVQTTTSGLHASTFHSLAYRMLEAHGAVGLGWTSMPELLTGPEQVALVAELLASEDPSRWPRAFAPLLTTQTFAEEVADFLLRSQEHLLTAAELTVRVTTRGDWRGLDRFRARYLAVLAERDRIDYGTLQSAAIDALAQDSVRSSLQTFRYILVDEYQDTTAAQARLLELLSIGNLTGVADPLQSIFSFRGAELGNVAEFGTRFAPARRFELTQSFRVPAAILDGAMALVAGHDDAPDVTPAPGDGRLERYVFHQQSQEAEWIAAEVERLHLLEDIPYRNIAVLVRSKRRFLPELSRALGRRGIPHDSPDSRLADHPAVRIVFDIARASILEGPGGDNPGGQAELDRIMRRLLLGPLFGLPLGQERELTRQRRRTGEPWSNLLRDHLPRAEALADLLADPAWAVDRPAADGFWHLWTALPQFVDIVGDPSRDDDRRAWSSLSQALGRQRDRDPSLHLAGYVKLADEDDFEATPLLSYRSGSVDQITLTTLHQSKGLEFDVVFIADAVEGVFPDLRRGRSLLEPRLLSRHQPADPAEAARLRLDEERRLAYTATTRAARRVVWTATKAGIDEAERRPSRFLNALGRAEPGLPDVDEREPVTPLEAEAFLRRLLADATAPAGRRLAAAGVLAAGSLRDPTWFSMVREQGSDQGIVDQPLTLSPSQATAYDACPRRYAFERRLRMGAEFGRYATFGSLIHDVLEYAERAAIARGDRRSTIDDALEELGARFDDYDFDAGTRRRAWYRRAVKLLVDLYDNWIRPGAEAVLLEHDLHLEIGGVPWRGRADRIERTADGTLRIVDYKTSSSSPAIKEAAESIQLAFYLAAARQDPSVQELGECAEAEFWYPLSKNKTKWFALDTDRVDDVLDTMRDIASGIASEDWTPRLGKGCERCAFRWVCPLWPEGQEAFVR